MTTNRPDQEYSAGTVDNDAQDTPLFAKGDSLFVPGGTVHWAKNTGKGPAKILSTYIIEKGKPIATPVK